MNCMRARESQIPFDRGPVDGAFHQMLVEPLCPFHGFRHSKHYLTLQTLLPDKGGRITIISMFSYRVLLA